MNYGSGLAKTGVGALVIGGFAITPAWQIAIVLTVLLVGALCIKAAGTIRRSR